MPLTELEQFLEERKGAIGGSDVHHLLGMPPYGCERRLFYEKEGTPPDFPFLGNRDTRRGSALESIACAEYEKDTGHALGRVGWRVHPEEYWVGVHLDRTIKRADKPGGLGGLEIKVPASRTYYQWKAEGPPWRAQVQLHWGMLVHSLAWGTLLAFNADKWEWASWDYDFDVKVAADLLKIAREFWRNVVQAGGTGRNPYPKLPDDDRRCKTCPFRRTCQGLGERAADLPGNEEELEGARQVVTDEGIFDRVANYMAAQKLMKDAKEAWETAKAELQAPFNNAPGAIACSLGTVRVSRVKRKGFTVEPTEYLSMRVSYSRASDEESIYGEGTETE